MIYIKNKIILLLLLIFNLSFANWEKIELKDDFGDSIDKYAYVKIVDYFQFLRLYTDENGTSLDVALGPITEVGELYTLKYKIDKNKPKEALGIAITDRIIRVPLLPELVEDMKKGNNITFLIYNTQGGAINLKTDLIGFTKYYNLITSQ